MNLAKADFQEGEGPMDIRQGKRGSTKLSATTLQRHQTW